ncbi:hypothetical protein [Nocardioides sp. GXQ0305]|uniref:hypothetical protein n=1 Tax=Nocardioides sp. GXQ0305 TaxID=3423912 RepID=UPI003D7CA6F4
MNETTPSTGRKTAGAFDVRVIIGALLGIYGAILLLMGLFGDPETDKTGGPNANLWAGLALVVTSAIFLAWWRLRPIVVPDSDDHDQLARPPEH